MNKKKNKAGMGMSRQRLRPKIWDASYILTRSDLKTVTEFEKLIKNDAKLLDIGCGYKPFKDILPHKEYVGIDFDKNASDADITLDCNKDKIPFSDSYFDAIIISNTLEHILNTDFLLSEVRRVLKKNGYLFISTPFMFCEHGVPHDYYRFTKYFYKMRFKEYKIVSLRTSNTFISTPFVVANQALEHMPISILRIPFVCLNNIIILVIDELLYLLAKMLKSDYINDGISRDYGGVSLILRK